MEAVQFAPRDAAASFDDLYRDSYRAMVFLARATTQSSTAAEEIVQDAFLQLYQRWNLVRQPRAWLRRAVLSLSASWVRSAVRARSASEKSAAFAVTEPAQPGEPAFNEVTTDVWSALSTLPPRQRAAVVLRYADDLSERQISEALGCRVGTVKSMLSRARETLRTELTDVGD